METKNRTEGQSGSTGITRLTDEQFERLRSFIEGELGIRMPPQKRLMLESRLQKRIRALGCHGFSDYIEHVFSGDGVSTELIRLIDAVTTNKTDFFREPDHFALLLDTILPDGCGRLGWGQSAPLRVWSAAAATGEEPYTLAMVLSEFGRTLPGFSFEVLATDISTEALEKGRRAVYREERIEPVPAELRKRYLLRSKDRAAGLVRVRPELRSRVRFARLNLNAEHYGLRSHFEIIFCRNVIIYFERPKQIELIERLCNHLTSGGVLVLGHAETLAGRNLPLQPVGPTTYRKIGGGRQASGTPDRDRTMSASQ